MGDEVCLTIVDVERFSQIKNILKGKKDQWEEKIGFLTSDEDCIDDDELEALTKLVKPKGQIISQDICERNEITKIKLQDVTDVLFMDTV